MSWGAWRTCTGSACRGSPDVGRPAGRSGTGGTPPRSGILVPQPIPPHDSAHFGAPSGHARAPLIHFPRTHAVTIPLCGCLTRRCQSHPRLGVCTPQPQPLPADQPIYGQHSKSLLTNLIMVVQLTGRSINTIRTIQRWPELSKL